METIEVRSASTPSWWFVPAGALAGCVLGVVARAWMRWISTDPEFTWAGTIGIVVSFGVFGAVQSTAAIARRRPVRPRLVASTRATAGVLSLGLFGAAGAVMLPTVLFGSVAVWRRGLSPVARAIFALLAVPAVVFVSVGIVDDHGRSLVSISAIAVFLAIYAVVIAATWPTTAPVLDGWRPSRRLVVAVAVVIGALLAAALWFGGIQT
jgi:hypothetical protein